MMLFLPGVIVGVVASFLFWIWRDDLIDVINMAAEKVAEWTKR